MKTTTEQTRATHSPGPWQTWLTGFDSSGFAIGPNGKTPILKTLGGDRELNKANARLAAAAPDLLAALQSCIDRMAELQEHTNYPLAWPRVQAMQAIEKATGK